jgi:hypothetical protein
MKGAIQMSNLENYMKQQAIFCEQNDSISKNLYSEYGVKRGLRDEKGQSVLTGLTNISDIKAFEYRDPYHVEPIELTKKRQRNVLLVQHLLGWARYLF